MARKLRLQFEGAIYHLMNRGDHQEPIFRGVKDRELFVKTLGEACAKTDWQVHAWCLMSNHFHLVVETPKANLVEGMKWLLGTYTGRFNHPRSAQYMRARKSNFLSIKPRHISAAAARGSAAIRRALWARFLPRDTLRAQDWRLKATGAGQYRRKRSCCRSARPSLGLAHAW